MLENEKILITGASSQVGLPVARELVKSNEVHGLGRFGNAEQREQLEGMGVRCIALDLATDSFDACPDDFDLVLNFAVVKSGDWDYDLAANAEGVGRLMSHCRSARAFLQCSSAAVYAEGMTDARVEESPYGDNHRLMLPTYSINKIAAETMARFGARQWNLPTTIARLSVPYGDNGGWPFYHLVMMRNGVEIPVHSDAPNLYNPIHEDDIVAQLPKLLDVAAVPATVVNWGGSEAVALEDWCGYLGTLTGLTPKFRNSENALRGLALDPTRMHELVGKTEVHWRDGLARMLEARAPDLIIDRTAI
jgi:UDP-glucuronate 4-epimerase